MRSKLICRRRGTNGKPEWAALDVLIPIADVRMNLFEPHFATIHDQLTRYWTQRPQALRSTSMCLEDHIVHALRLEEERANGCNSDTMILETGRHQPERHELDYQGV